MRESSVLTQQWQHLAARMTGDSSHSTVWPCNVLPHVRQVLPVQDGRGWCDFPHYRAWSVSLFSAECRGLVTVAALGSLFPSITKESLAMLLHQFISVCFWIPVVVILIYVVVKRRESDAVFILSFTIVQISPYIMLGSFRYHEAIILKQGGKRWENPSWIIIHCLDPPCSLQRTQHGQGFWKGKSPSSLLLLSVSVWGKLLLMG